MVERQVKLDFGNRELKYRDEKSDNGDCWRMKMMAAATS